MSEELLNKYERARVLGARALQLAMGAPPKVRAGDERTPLDVAEREFEKDKTPLEVVKSDGKRKEGR